jgi:hypothetical protein
MSREEVWTYLEMAPLSVATATDIKTDTRTVRRPKLSELAPRPDAPPL